MKAGIVALVLLFPAFVFAHEFRQKSHENNTTSKTDHVTHEKLNQINTVYLQSIKPIFKNKCMDCHSQQTEFPWYHKIPGIKQMMNNDVKLGLDHIDLSNDFPFKGHGSPEKDLQAMKEVAEKGSMPPWSYALMHRDSKLTNDEKKTIKKWADDGLELLRQKEKK